MNRFKITESDMKKMVSECVRRLVRENVESSVDDTVLSFFANKKHIYVKDGDDYEVGEYIMFDLDGGREIYINYIMDGTYHEQDGDYSYDEEPYRNDYFDVDFNVVSVSVYDNSTDEEEYASKEVCKKIENMLYLEESDAEEYLEHDTDEDRYAAEFGDPFDRD